MKLGAKMKEDGVLMFSGNQWALFKVDTKNFSSWVYHCCNPMAAKFTINRFLTFTELHFRNPKCWKCRQHVPDDIMALWTLHNFDSMSTESWGEDWKQLREYNIDYG
jgi:hypothetical protein